MISELKKNAKRYGSFNWIRLAYVGIDNMLTYFTKKKPTVSPMYVGWNVTYRCNCFCVFCDTHDFEKKDVELNTQEALDLVCQLGKAKVVQLTLSGGEPLLRPDIFTIIKEAKKWGINVNMATNGALLEQKAEKLIEAGIDSIGVSLDSLIPEEHNTNRKHKNLYQKVEKSLKKVDELRQQSQGKPILVISTIVNKSNYRALDAFISHWKQFVDQVVIQPIQSGNNTSLFQISDESLSFDPEDRAAFEAEMKKLLKKYPELNNPYEREFSRFLFDQKGLYQKYKCPAGFMMLQVDAFGNIFPCTENIWRLGNIRQNSFMAILHDRAAHKTREFIRQGKNKCFCWYRCTGPFMTTLRKVTSGRKPT